MNFVAEALQLSKFSAERLAERGILKKAFVKHPFFEDIEDAYRIEKKFGTYEEGTVIVKSCDGLKVFRGYPKIRRILVLDPALEKHFGDKEFVLEEKMNGYNVRVVKIGKNLYAITRRGLFCPYTTEKVREKFESDFFDTYPDYVLCCEAVGKASPYVPDHYGIEGLDFFVFDIRNCETNKPLAIDEKEKLAKKFGFKTVEILMRTTAKEIEEIKKAIAELNAKRREGVVFKDFKMEIEPLKYTTSFANCSDLSYGFRYFEDYARDFMLARILREAFQAFEFCDSIEDRCRRFGEAILLAIIDSINTVNKGKDVAETFNLSFSKEEILELFKTHAKLLGINLREVERKISDGRIDVTFERVMRATTDRAKHLLKGGTW